MGKNDSVSPMTRTMTRTICGDSGVVNLVLDSFIVSCMVIRSRFSYRALLMSHPLSGQCAVCSLYNLYLLTSICQRETDCVSIKKLRDKIVIRERHSYSGKSCRMTDPFVPLDTLDHAAGQGSSQRNRRIRYPAIDSHDRVANPFADKSLSESTQLTFLSHGITTAEQNQYERFNVLVTDLSIKSCNCHVNVASISATCSGISKARKHTNHAFRLFVAPNKSCYTDWICP